VPVGPLDGVRSDRENLSVALLELLDAVPQLQEVPPAERSVETPQEYEDDVAAPEVGQPDLFALGRGQGEVRRLCAYWDGIALYGHGGMILWQ
ncbi:MAG: hypothetical protein V3S20_09135, partial [Dehalococcoidia bacterium]